MGIAAYVKKVKVGANDLPVKSASMSHGGDLLDDTEMATNAGYRSRLYGLRDVSIQCEAVYDASDTALTAVRNGWLNRAVLNAGGSGQVSYLPDGTNGFKGDFVVESFDLSGDVDGLEMVSFTLQGVSALTAVP